MVENVLPLIVNGIDSVVQFFTKYKVALFIVAGGITGALIPAMVALGVTIMTVTIPAIISMSMALAPFILGGAIIAGIVAGIYYLIKNWDKVAEMFGNMWSYIMDKMTAVRDVWTSIVEAIKNATNNAFDAVKDKVESVINFVKAQIERLKSMVDSLKSFAGGVGAKITGAFGGGKAVGGPVTSGTPYMVGERGPEMFVPNSSGRIVPNHRLAGAGGGPSITVNITGGYYVGERGIDEFAEMIGDKFAKKLGMNMRINS